MADLLDYLDWRGDIPFSADPFNEVDNLVLSELAYVDFDGIVPGPALSAVSWIDMADASRRYWEVHTEEEIARSNTLFRRAPLLLKKLCSGARFGHMRLTGYVNQVSVEKNEQMSALICLLDDGTAYAAFRGTDDTIVGWKEDFSFSFRRETAGQKSAARYLSSCFGKSGAGLPGPVRVGGHSKGGNFAVYASAFCDEDVRDRIQDIYTNDGPGFLEDVTDTPGYRRILPRVHSIVPEESVFGLLLDCGYYHKVVKSSGRGIWQHDALSWQVMRNRFEEAPGLSEGSTLVEKTVESWIRGMPLEDRQEFVDVVFSLFSETGIENMSEITADQFRTIPELLRAYLEMGGRDKRFLHDTVGRLLKSGADSLNEELQARVRKLLEK